MEGDSVLTQSPEDVLKILGNLQTAVDATASSANPLLTKWVIALASVFDKLEGADWKGKKQR